MENVLIFPFQLSVHKIEIQADRKIDRQDDRSMAKEADQKKKLHTKHRGRLY